MLAAVLHRRHITTGIAAALALSACTPAGGRADAAVAVALRLLDAVAAKDGATACATLAPDTVRAVATDQPCPRAILEAELPEPGPVRKSAVYGQWAQVRLSADTVFLAVFPGGWRVVAAGCKPQGDRPYDCSVQGG